MTPIEAVYVQAGDIAVTVTSRRRYGATTYTWLRFVGPGIDAQPDPWPCTMPARAEVLAEAARLRGAR